MFVGVDSYSYHRFFGDHYKDLQAPIDTRLTQVEFLDRIAGMGANSVSLECCFIPDTSDSALAEIKSTIDKHGLFPVWAWGHPNGFHSGKKPEALEDLIYHLTCAAKIGAKQMRICAGGRTTMPADWSEHKAAITPLMRAATIAAKDHGITLALENHIDFLADQMVELVEEVDSDHFGICFDTANNLRMFEDPIVVAQKFAPFTKATHIKNIVAHKGDPKTFGFWPSVPVDQGLVDMPEVLRILKSTGYSGALTIEVDYLHPDYGDEDSAISHSIIALKKMVAAL